MKGTLVNLAKTGLTLGQRLTKVQMMYKAAKAFYKSGKQIVAWVRRSLSLENGKNDSIREFPVGRWDNIEEFLGDYIESIRTLKKQGASDCTIYRKTFILAVCTAVALMVIAVQTLSWHTGSPEEECKEE